MYSASFGGKGSLLKVCCGLVVEEAISYCLLLVPEVAAIVFLSKILLLPVPF